MSVLFIYVSICHFSFFAFQLPLCPLLPAAIEHFIRDLELI